MAEEKEESQDNEDFDMDIGKLTTFVLGTYSTAKENNILLRKVYARVSGKNGEEISSELKNEMEDIKLIMRKILYGEK